MFYNFIYGGKHFHNISALSSLLGHCLTPGGTTLNNSLINIIHLNVNKQLILFYES
jgi:hypothetical protein